MPADSDARATRRTRQLLAGILVLGVLLRLLHLAFVLPTPFPRWPLVADQTDMYAFWQWAQRIVAGDWLGRDPYHPYFTWMQQMNRLETWYRWWGGKQIFHQAPLYPYALAGLLSINNSPSFVILVQLLLGSLQPLVLFALARRLFDDRVGLVAAAFTAFYGPFIFYQSVLLRDWLLPLLEPLVLVMVLHAIDRLSGAAWLLAGFAMGVSVLTKETALVLIAITLGWVVIQYRHAWREAVRAVAWLCAGFLICTAPLVTRNILVGAPPWAISVQGTGNVVVGLAPDTFPAGFSVPSPEARAIIRRSQGSTLAALRESLLAYPDGVRGLTRHQLWKLRALVDPFEIPNNVNYYYAFDMYPVLSASLGYGLIFPLGAAGVFLMLKAWPRPSLFYCYLVAALGVQLLTIILARFRLAFVPVLILAAAFFVVRLFVMLKELQIVPLVGSLSLVIAIIFVQQVWAPVTTIPRTLRVAEYEYSAKVYAAEGQMDLAMTEMSRLIAKARLNPAYRDLVAVGMGHYHLLWATQLLEKGLWQEARSQALEAQEAYQAQSSFAHWPYNLAVLYLKLDDPDKAKIFLRQFLEREPVGPRADEARAVLFELGE